MTEILIVELALEVSEFQKKWSRYTENDALEFYSDKKELGDKLDQLSNQIEKIESESEKQKFKLLFHPLRRDFLAIEVNLSVELSKPDMLNFAKTKTQSLPLSNGKKTPVKKNKRSSWQGFTQSKKGKKLRKSKSNNSIG